MSVSLQKGQKVNLSKEHAGLAKVIVGLGWDEAKPSGGGGLFGCHYLVLHHIRQSTATLLQSC